MASSQPHETDTPSQAIKPINTTDAKLPIGVVVIIANHSDLPTIKNVRLTGRFVVQKHGLTSSWFLSRFAFLYRKRRELGGETFARDLTKAGCSWHALSWHEGLRAAGAWVFKSVRKENVVMLWHSLAPLKPYFGVWGEKELGQELLMEVGKALQLAAANGWEVGVDMLVDAFVRGWDSHNIEWLTDGHRQLPEDRDPKAELEERTLMLLSAAKRANDGGHVLCREAIINSATNIRSSVNLPIRWNSLTLGRVLMAWGRQSVELSWRLVKGILSDESWMVADEPACAEAFVTALVVHTPELLPDIIAMSLGSHHPRVWIWLSHLIVVIGVKHRCFDAVNAALGSLEEEDPTYLRWLSHHSSPLEAPLEEAIKQYDEEQTEDTKVYFSLLS